MKQVIIGDGQWEKVESVETRKVDYGSDYRDFVGETEFDGHHVLWGFEYFPTTYLKSSGLSGDEYRKGGEIRYFRNRKQCFSEFCREPKIAALKIGGTLLKLMDFDWEKLKVGEKVWFERTPAIIEGVIEEQGCVILKTEDGSNFPNAIWHDENDGALGEREERIKVEILSDNIYWYRKTAPTNITRSTANPIQPQDNIGDQPHLKE